MVAMMKTGASPSFALSLGVITQTMLNHTAPTSPEVRRRQPPMYQVLKADIEKDIREGRLCPGELVPSESALIAKYHVSSTTARRCLDELENEGLLERKRGKGTFVSGLATVLNRVRVAVVVKDFFSLAHPFLATVVGAIESTLENAGVHIAIVKAHFAKDGIGADSRLSDLLEHEGIRHAFLLSNMPLSFVQTALDLDIKCLGVNTRYLDPRIPSVCSDYGLAFAMRLSELAKRGHRRIATLTQEAPMAQLGVMNSASLLLEAYAEQRVQYPDLPETPLIRQVDIDEDIATVVDALLEQHPDLTAFLCWDELAGLEVNRRLVEKGIRVPEQISIVGSRILPASPLACVDVPIEEIGRIAAELMLEWMSGKRPDSRIIAPNGFLVRETLTQASLAS